jgi:hypothetical protein
LLPTQDHVSVGNPDTLRSKIETQPSEMGSLVRVAKFGGKYNIIDGHHRVLGAILRKDKEIPVRVFNVDRPKQKSKRKK